MGNIGTGELLIILAIVVLIFGVNKIPQLGKGLGEGIRNFKSALKSEDENAKKQS
jgi:sec-independent protein translocase protein TatA